MGRRRPMLNAPKPSLLACALIEDGGRHFFLERMDMQGRLLLELPSILLMAGEDPVSSLALAIRAQTGIDAQVHLPVLRGKYNAGNRRRPHPISALAFSCASKRIQPKLAAPYSGFRWLKPLDAKKEKFGKLTDWILRCERVAP